MPASFFDRPILNSPYRPPARHHALDRDGQPLDQPPVEGRANPGLLRLAMKMTTGSGKTIVMAKLIAWQTVNAVRRPGSALYSRGFLVVAPAITIKDRLRALQPNDPDSYYHARELVPADMLPSIDRAKIVITTSSPQQAWGLRPTRSPGSIAYRERAKKRCRRSLAAPASTTFPPPRLPCAAQAWRAPVHLDGQRLLVTDTIESGIVKLPASPSTTTCPRRSTIPS